MHHSHHLLLSEVTHSESHFVIWEQGVHRLPIVDSQNNLVGIVSQSDIINFLTLCTDSPELIKIVQDHHHHHHRHEALLLLVTTTTCPRCFENCLLLEGPL